VPTAEELAANPLLTDSPFPRYATIEAQHVVPGVRGLLGILAKEVDELETSLTSAGSDVTWDMVAVPLERIADRLGRAWGAVGHLKAVKDTEAFRAAVEEVQPERVDFSLRLSQSRPLYDAFRALRDGPAWDGLSEARRRVVEGELRDFQLGGVGLEGAERDRFNAIQRELSQLSTSFSNNVLDATKAFKRLCKDKTEVEGIPASALRLAASQAEAAGERGATAEEGPWLFTLDMPSMLPVLQHCANADLRKEVWTANVTRASELSPKEGEKDLDNRPVIDQILALKKEKAALLGYSCHADVSMASKMATLETARGLLEDLRAASWDAAVADLDEVRAFAAERGHKGDLEHWDITYWAERLREDRYAISDEDTRPYFSLDASLDGLFRLAKRLFGCDIVAVDRASDEGENIPVWNDEVRVFRIDVEGSPKAYFYLDPYARPAEKRGGAWMDEVAGQSALFAAPGEKVRLPVAHMVLNQAPPAGGVPSLMSFREVETLFHEAGHALQSLLTTQTEGLVAGIRGVEWDAVELPSQFMENWALDRATLFSFARHHATGEALPEELFSKLVAAKNFRAGSMSLRQVHFALTDLSLHSTDFDPSTESIFDHERKIASKTCVLPPRAEDRFLCAFSHIFAGGYAAGYYSYKWAEVLSADAFSAFEDAGLDDEDAVRATGRRFRETVLGVGGGRAPLDVFVDFRGREPTTDALLRHTGLAPATA
jgi:oligopeptidase A